jgi:hypothetical protein
MTCEYVIRPINSNLPVRFVQVHVHAIDARNKEKDILHMLYPYGPFLSEAEGCAKGFLTALF